MKKSFDIDKNHRVKVNEYWRKDPRYIHQHLSWFDVMVLKIKRFFRLLFTSLFIIGSVFLFAIVYREYNPKTIPDVQVQTIIDSSLEDKIEELKWRLVDDIFNVERGGHIENDGLITFDPNLKRPSVEIPSIGDCQFKVPTMQEKYLKYYGDKLTRKEAIIVSLDDEKCKNVMYHTIFQEKEGWRNWYNTCTKKVECEVRINRIRELEK